MRVNLGYWNQVSIKFKEQCQYIHHPSHLSAACKHKNLFKLPKMFATTQIFTRKNLTIKCFLNEKFYFSSYFFSKRRKMKNVITYKRLSLDEEKFSCFLSLTCTYLLLCFFFLAFMNRSQCFLCVRGGMTKNC